MIHLKNKNQYLTSDENIAASQPDIKYSQITSYTPVQKYRMSDVYWLKPFLGLRIWMPDGSIILSFMQF